MFYGNYFYKNSRIYDTNFDWKNFNVFYVKLTLEKKYQDYSYYFYKIYGFNEVENEIQVKKEDKKENFDLLIL